MEVVWWGPSAGGCIWRCWEKLEGVNVEDVGGVDNKDDEMNGRDALQLLRASHKFGNKIPETETPEMHVISAYLNSFPPTPLVP